MKSATKREVSRIIKALAVRDLPSRSITYLREQSAAFNVIRDVPDDVTALFYELDDACEEEIMRSGLGVHEILAEFTTPSFGARWLDNMHGFRVSEEWLGKAAECRNEAQAARVIRDSSARRRLIKQLRDRLAEEESDE